MSKRKAPVVNNITYNINNYFSRLTGPAPEPGPSNEPPNLFPNDERRNFKYVSRVVSLAEAQTGSKRFQERVYDGSLGAVFQSSGCIGALTAQEYKASAASSSRIAECVYNC